jgi:hypothetical protein
LAVSTHVTLGHAGRADLLAGRPWQVVAIALFLGVAVVSRALMDVDPARFYSWMTLASASFLGGVGAWAQLLLPQMTLRS